MTRFSYILTSTVLAAMMVTATMLVSVPSTQAAGSAETTTPIKHLVIIFQENVSYDHYFATYPNASNPSGQPEFHAKANTPSANGLTQQLIDNNPNSAKPFRLDRTQAVTCDQNHEYKAEQEAYHGGLLDKFVEKVGSTDKGCDPKQVMGYFDGNTATALWNYAQHFAMSDNSFSTTFGPSTPGALNLVAGQTHGATPANIPEEVVNGTVIGDPDGTFDDCSKGQTVAMSGKNVGDLLNEKGVTWGWFQGGFKPSSMTADGRAICASSHQNIAGQKVTDYSAHHEPFEYFTSTANPHHLPPTSASMIGKTDPANHQYDLEDFWSAVDSNNMPAVSFLKAAKYQDGHAGYSDPLDEQTFLVGTLNHLQKSPQWKDTAVIIMYDDSDGWYDHVMPPIVNHSSDPVNDALLGSGGLCGDSSAGSYQDRCGYGPRQPLLVVSPWSKQNYLDHQVTDQSSALMFIEENWHLGTIGDQSFDTKAGSLQGMFDFNRRDPADKLFLDRETGTRQQGPNDTATIKVNALGPDGKDLRMFIRVAANDGKTILSEGFAPFEFTGEKGNTYQVRATNFEDRIFDSWADNGSTNRHRMVTLNSDMELTAKYAMAGDIKYKAHLSGSKEIPPVNTTATGMAEFKLNADATQLSYKLNVTGIDKVTMAHLHLSPEGVNGPVVVTLYNAAPGGEVNGVLAQGTITAANLTGPLAGKPLIKLIDEISSGQVYVNVHSTDHPGGEMRGQLS
jgi:phospholipase C